MNIIIIFGMSFLVGFLLKKLKIPGGMMIGSLLFCVFYVNKIEPITLPFNLGLISQVLAGACIGAKLHKKDLLLIKNIFKEIIIINIGLLLLSVFSGFVLYYLFKMNPYDAFFGSIPGGMTSIPLIGLDYGANPINVTLLQFVRLIIGIGFFPKFISRKVKLNPSKLVENEVVGESINKKDSLDSWKKTGVTLLFTFAAVLLLEAIHFPVSILVSAIFVSAIYSIVTSKGHIDETVYMIAQLSLGIFIGSSVSMGNVNVINDFLLPSITVAIVFGLGSYLLGRFIFKVTDFNETEAYFSAIPAGAADLGLITHELGVFSSNIIVVQIARVVIVTSMFPYIMDLVIRIFIK